MKFSLKIVQGDTVNVMEVEAGNSLQARSIAEEQGHHVLSISQQKAVNLKIASLKTTKFNVMLFSQELLALIESGLSLVEAIEALAEKETHA
ncbi:MAG TPA: type II secretion system F family protein, partial [Methylophaga sp.]|nr:type II secretion system F family protein [Methylophaga sp.]